MAVCIFAVIYTWFKFYTSYRLWWAFEDRYKFILWDRVLRRHSKSCRGLSGRYLWSFFYKSIVPKIRQNVSKKLKQQLQRNMPQQKIKQDKNSST